MFKLKILFISILFPISIYSNDNYLVKLKIEKDTISISAEVNFENKVDFLILDKCFELHSILSANDTLKKWTKASDTIFLNRKVSKVSVDYSCAKSDFQLNDGSIILKNEGKWVPSLRKMLVDAEIDLSFDKEEYIPVISQDTINGNKYYFNGTFDLTLLLLPKDKYAKTLFKNKELVFSLYHYKTKEIDLVFLNEFFDSFSFFNRFFDTHYTKMNLMYVGSEEFNICQSLHKMILFGDYFYKVYKYDTVSSWIPHEIAHQWWGRSVFFEPQAVNYRFIEESVTEFLKTYYIKEKYGEENLQKLYNRYKTYYDHFVNDTNSISISEIKNLNNQINGLTIYSKGPLLLAKIQKEFPECNLQTIIKEVYSKSHGKLIAFSDLKKMINLKSPECSEKLTEMLNSKDKFW